MHARCARRANKNVRKALAVEKLGPMPRYCATRHTYASQWVLAGGSREKLAKTMGHSTTEVTSRYAHLRADLFTAEDRGLFAVNMTRKSGKVTKLPAPAGTVPGAIGSQLVRTDGAWEGDGIKNI